MARPKKEKSLHRGKRVYIRFTELEYELVAGYAKDAGYPIGTFVRKQALREKLEVNYNIVADLGEIQNLTVQVAGIGNNLNQIARYFHSGGLASRGMLEELKRCIAEMPCAAFPPRNHRCAGAGTSGWTYSPCRGVPNTVPTGRWPGTGCRASATAD